MQPSSALRDDVIAFGNNGTVPPPESASDGSYAYPQLTLALFRGRRPRATAAAPSGGWRCRAPTPPRSPAPTCSPLPRRTARTDRRRDIEIEIERRTVAAGNPFPLCPRRRSRGGDGRDLLRNELARHFPSTDLALIGDELADGIEFDEDPDMPLSLFDALRTDYSLARLAHYTGTSAERLPALHPVHQLSPLCRRIRRLGRASRSATTAPIPR